MDQGRDGDGADKRQDRRARVLIGAKVIVGGRTIDVRLRDLSPHGALLLAATPPPLRSEVTFERGELSAKASVVWRHGDRFGIQFDEPIEEQDVMAHGEPSRPYEPPLHCKPPAMGVKSDIFSHALTPEERATAEAWFQSHGRSLD
jgi:hypothetical protein